MLFGSFALWEPCSLVVSNNNQILNMVDKDTGNEPQEPAIYVMDINLKPHIW